MPGEYVEKEPSFEVVRLLCSCLIQQQGWTNIIIKHLAPSDRRDKVCVCVCVSGFVLLYRSPKHILEVSIENWRMEAKVVTDLRSMDSNQLRLHRWPTLLNSASDAKTSTWYSISWSEKSHQALPKSRARVASRKCCLSGNMGRYWKYGHWI